MDRPRRSAAKPKDSPPKAEETLASLREEIRSLVEEYFSIQEEIPLPPERHPLGVPNYGAPEVLESLDALLSGNLSMGEKVAEFEKRVAKKLGSSEAVMVNSGSSANLLAFSILSGPDFPNRLKPGDEVIVPALSWSTSIAPIVQVGAVPVFVDVLPGTLCIDPEEIKKALTPKTRAILCLHILGNACRMPEILAIAKERNAFVVEDACEALATTLDGKAAGTFGDAGTLSFFFSHHLNTIEGGMILTERPEIADTARILRAHGWAREAKEREKLAAQHPGIDPRFLFVQAGFNVRPTEIQGAFGLHQLERLDGFNEARRRNAALWTERLSPWSKWIQTTTPEKGCVHTWFYFPLFVTPEAPFTRSELQNYLEENSIETRMVLAGNFVKQPMAKKFFHRVVGDLPRSNEIMERGLLFGNSGALPEGRAEWVAGVLEKFLRRYK